MNRNTTMKTRILTGCALTLLAFLILAFSHIPLILSLACALLGLLCYYELRATLGYPGGIFSILCPCLAVVLPFLPSALFPPILFFLLFLCMAVLSTSLMRAAHAKIDLPKGVILLYLFLPLCLVGVRILREEAQGFYLLCLALFTAAANDTGAYFCGTCFGKHALSPIVSPKKTYEGAVGGLLFAFLLLGGLAIFLTLTGKLVIRSYFYFSAYIVSASLIGILGDLCFSAIKRLKGKKDYSTLLPGHGGVLDRIDSFLFVLPFTVLYNSLYPFFG